MSVTQIKKIIRKTSRLGLIGVRPRGFCFIAGCPRSGTTALGEWLDLQSGTVQMNETRILVACHAMVKKVGYFKDLDSEKRNISKALRHLVLDQYASRRFIGTKLLIDKEPLEPIAFPEEDYIEFLESVQFIFPDVKLLFIIRDPLATVWSIINRKWGYSLSSHQLRNFSIEQAIEIWKENAKIISNYRNRPNTYVCQFEKLISDPEESKRIANFLGIKLMQPFKSRPTRKVEFPKEEGKLILDNTRELRKLFSY